VTPTHAPILVDVLGPIATSVSTQASGFGSR